MSHSKNPINWVNTLFLTITPIVAIVGTVLLCVFSTVPWQTWVLAVSYLFITGLAITAGYHRLFSHKSYGAVWPVRLVFALLGAASFEGSVLEWCTDHRNHHRYTDTDKDPYDIKKGFWFAHMGWLIRLDQKQRDFSNVADLQADKFIAWQHRFFVLLATFMGFILPALIASLWGDPLGGLIIAGVLRVTMNHHFTFAINSVCHMFGKKNYSDRQSARDNWVTALFTYGEGYHNFHHQFPLDYRNGVRSYHFDPAKWLITALVWLGLAHNVKRVSQHKIIKYRLQMQEKNMPSIKSQFGNVAASVRDNLYSVLHRVEILEKEYLNLRRQPGKKRDNRVYKQCQRQLRAAQYELKKYLSLWSHLLDCHSKLVKVSV